MHQTKYFGLFVFFDYSCVFSPSLAQITGSLLYMVEQVVLKTSDRWRQDFGWKTQQTDRWTEQAHKAFFAYNKA
jgi:hypothetical protein